MQLELEGSNHTKVPAAAAQRPEQVRIFVGARRNELPVGQYDVRSQQIVDGEAVPARQIPDSPAQGEAGHSGSGNGSGRRSHAECMRRMVHFAPDASSIYAHGLCGRVHANAFHARQIDHHSVVACSETSAVVPASADGGKHVALSAEPHRRDHVGNVCASRYQARAFVDHAVIHFARGLVRRIVRLDQLPSERAIQFVHRLWGHRILLIDELLDDGINVLWIPYAMTSRQGERPRLMLAQSRGRTPGSIAANRKFFLLFRRF
jgi:hypothetical protein